MNTKTLPSNLRSLSLAISQVVLLSGGMASAAMAVPGCITVNPSNPLTVATNETNYVCQDDSGQVSVTLAAGVTLDASNYKYGVDAESGSVTLGDKAQIVINNSTQKYATGIEMELGDGDQLITLGADSAIKVSSAAANSNNNIDGIEVYTSSGSTTVTLGNGSLVSAASTAQYRSDATAIDASSYSYGDGKTVTKITGDTATISATAVSTSSDIVSTSSAEAEAISVYSEGYYEAAETIVNLSNSSISASSVNYGEFSRSTTIDAFSKSYEADASTTVSLSSSEITSTASSVSGDARASGIYAGSESESFYNATNNLTLNSTNVTVSANGHGYAESAGIYSFTEGEDGSNNTITLNQSTLNVSAAGYSTQAAGAYIYSDSIYEDSAVSINLSGSAINTSATGEKYAESVGLMVSSDSREGNATSAVILNDSSINVGATSEESAIGFGLTIGSYSDEGNSSNTVSINDSSIEVNTASQTKGFSMAAGTLLSGSSTVSINDSSIKTTASGYYAISTAATGKYSQDGNNTIEINQSSISSTSNGEVVGIATGIALEGTENSITLSDTTINVAATISNDEGFATASGLTAYSDQTSAITLNNSTVNVSSSGNIYAEGNGKYTSGIQVYGGSSETTSTVTLNGSKITVNADDGFGIQENSDSHSDSAGTVISLDANSSIIAETAVYSNNVNSQLNNAGNIQGDIIFTNQVTNSGTITGDLTVGTLDNSGDITGLIVGNTINNSGNMYGLVGGNTLNVKNGGVIAGTADVATLNVAAGGELQAIMDDTTKTDEAHFTAVNATLADGAKIHINATSELFDVDLKGADYLIVKADESLDANEENLELRASGLVGVQWAENCDDLSLCVNVRALNLEELAQESNAPLNSIKAASAAQSVLAQLAGTDKGDAFMEFFGRIADNGNWNGVEGSSAQGSSLAASNASERVATRYVQRMMKAGRSSGEEFQGERGLWIQALQVNGDGDSTSGVAGFEVDTTGLAIGYNAELKPGLLIGGAFSYADSEVESDDNVSQSESDSYMATLYTQWTQGVWFANGMFTYGQGDNDGTRMLGGDRIRADYDSDMFSVRFQGGRSFTAESGLSLSPRVELNYNHTDIDSYDEKGSVAALSVGSQSYETIEVGVGAELSKAFVVDRSVLTPYLDVVVYQDLSQDQVQTNNRFVLGGDSFVTEGGDVAKTNVSATMGLDYAMSSASSLRASYEYFGNSNYKSSAWMLRYSYSF